MRIGVDARPLAHPKSGIGRYTHQLLNRLKNSPDHQWFLYGAPATENPWPDSSNITYRAHNSVCRGLNLLLAPIRFRTWARRDEVDVYWSPRHHLPLALRSIPCVITIHDCVWRLFPDTMLPQNLIVERLLTPASLKQATRIITVSQSTARDLVAFYPGLHSRVDVIYEANSLCSVAAKSINQPPYMLFVGTLEPRKNLQRCFEALAKLKSMDIKVPRLVIAGGRGWKMKPLNRSLAAMGLEQNVDYVGPADDKHLAALYAGCKFLLFPSLYEGFGLPILEALSFGKPVITSNTSSMPEVAGDAAILVDPHSVKEIVDAITRLSSDDELFDSLASRAVPQAAKFSWDTAAEQTLKIIEQAGSSGSRG